MDDEAGAVVGYDWVMSSGKKIADIVEGGYYEGTFAVWFGVASLVCGLVDVMNMAVVTIFGDLAVIVFFG